MLVLTPLVPHWPLLCPLPGHDHLSITISVATVTIIAASGSLRETLYLSSIFYFVMVSNVHLMVWFFDLLFQNVYFTKVEVLLGITHLRICRD